MEQIAEAARRATIGSQTTAIEPCEVCKRVGDHHLACPESTRLREIAERFGRIVDGVAECGLPAAYVTGERSYDTFDASRHPSLAAALSKVKLWSEGALTSWVFGYGDVGLGKTHLAGSALADVIRRGGTGRFTKLSSMLIELQSCPLDEKQRVFRRYSRAKHLVLDEVGAEKASEFTISTISAVLDERYELNLRTFINSNLTLDELASKFAPGDEATSARRIVDRIYERTGKRNGAGRIRFEGRSYRKG